ncbi:MAG: BadF/BadG/BcrA/BcrD type ATPase [Chloroflexi bacterium]|nr:BadF/BadG/BcrA/BcrD type ATPase [Chloroflexota bacterium]
MELAIGIDAGGTHTRARIANARGETLGTGEAGAGNPHVAGRESAQREILNAIQRARADAGILSGMEQSGVPSKDARIAAVCLGMSGVDRADERAEWTTWAREQIAPRARVINDGEIVLAAGTPDNWGIAVIAGTGSLAWGKTREGKIARAGGWGYLIGDDGSAFELARGGLHAAAQAADGRGASTRLLRDILAFWNLREPHELIARVYRSGLKPGDLAQLASIVVRAAEQGDPVAFGLVMNAGEALAITIHAVAHKLEIAHETIPLAMTGGLALSAQMIRAHLLAAAMVRDLNLAPVALVHEPVTGAVRLAINLIRE